MERRCTKRRSAGGNYEVLTPTEHAEAEFGSAHGVLRIQPRSEDLVGPGTGACLPLPEGFTGQVLSRQQQQAPSDEAADVWQATQRFGALHYWNHDAHPAAMDGVPRVLEWLAAAKAVCLSMRCASSKHVLTGVPSRAGTGTGSCSFEACLGKRRHARLRPAACRWRNPSRQMHWRRRCRQWQLPHDEFTDMTRRDVHTVLD